MSKEKNEIRVLDYSDHPQNTGMGDSTFHPTLDSMDALQATNQNLMQTLQSTSPVNPKSFFSNNTQDQTTPDKNKKDNEKEESYQIVKELLNKRKQERSITKSSKDAKTMSALTLEFKHEKYKQRDFTSPQQSAIDNLSPKLLLCSKENDQKRQLVKSATEQYLRKKSVNNITYNNKPIISNTFDKRSRSTAGLKNETMSFQAQNKSRQYKNSQFMTSVQKMANHIEKSNKKVQLISCMTNKNTSQITVKKNEPNVWERMKVRDNIRRDTMLAKTMKSRFLEMAQVTGKPYISKNSRILATQSAHRIVLANNNGK